MATTLAIEYYCAGWVHAKVTRPPYEATDIRSLAFLRAILGQGVTMCADLRTIINEWPNVRVPVAWWTQYKAAKRFQTDLDSAILAIEDGWEQECS